MVNEYSIQKGGNPATRIVIGAILTFILVWSIIQSTWGCVFLKGGRFI